MPVEKKESSMTIGAGLGLDQISKNMNDFINNKNNYGNTGKNNSGSGRKEKVIVESNKTLNNKTKEETGRSLPELVEIFAEAAANHIKYPLAILKKTLIF